MYSECVFCEIAAGRIKAEVLYQDDDIIAFRDINAQAPLHVLLIPRKHIETLNDVSPGDADILSKLILAAKELAGKEGISEDGYRLVINCNRNAGQEVFHLHVHLLGGRKFSWPPG